MLDSSETDVLLEDSGAKTFTNGSSSGGVKGLTSKELSTAATRGTDDD